jgi:hypothetical protein
MAKLIDDLLSWLDPGRPRPPEPISAQDVVVRWPGKPPFSVAQERYLGLGEATNGAKVVEASYTTQRPRWAPPEPDELLF